MPTGRAIVIQVAAGSAFPPAPRKWTGTQARRPSRAQLPKPKPRAVTRNRRLARTSRAPSRIDGAGDDGQAEHPRPREAAKDPDRGPEGQDRREAGGEGEDAERASPLPLVPPRGDEPAAGGEAERLRVAVERPRHEQRPEAPSEAGRP